MMNNWQNEFMAEYRRQEILDEVEKIRLEKLTVSSRVYRPRLFERTMFNFANWMISTGKQLRKRYEVPAVNCNHPPTGSFAQ
ncbi:MAG TPA: hypothetical protein VF896_12695 [Anaerolineales bacterium]